MIALILCAACAAFETPNLRIEPQGVGAAFVATDRRTGRAWKPSISVNKARVANLRFDYAADPERPDEFTDTLYAPGPAEAEPCHDGRDHQV